jgi:hypothetical protein
MEQEMYDSNKVGKCIAWSGDHYVYEYGQNEVIKFSKFDFFLGKQKALEKSSLDREVCAKYFGTNYLDTKILFSTLNHKVAIIQPKIQGKFLSIEDLSDTLIKEQFQEIMKG